MARYHMCADVGQGQARLNSTETVEKWIVILEVVFDRLMLLSGYVQLHIVILFIGQKPLRLVHGCFVGSGFTVWPIINLVSTVL